MLPRTASTRDEGVLAALLVAAVVAFNVWTVESVTPSTVSLWGADKQGDYSNLTLDGFMAGHLYLTITPPPALVNAENPYDPSKRPPGVALADISYYRSHYYSYFGVAPVVTLFLPWRVLTGHDLPAPFAALIFVNGAFLLSALLWWRLRRRYFPESGALSLAIGILAIGMASMTYAVLRRTSLWEPPVAAGYFFSTASIFCLYSGLHSRRLLAWFCGAGLLMGLAVGSRPTLIVGASAFAAPLALAWMRRSKRAGGNRPSWSAQALALGAPFGVILVGLFAYNYGRFGNPLEFGLNYQLTGAYEAMVRHFSVGYARFNAYVYYLAPAHWSRYFPFVEPVHLPAAPAGYYSSEYVYGVLSNVPISWLAFLAPLALLRRPQSERGELSAFLGSIAAYFVAVGTFLLLFVTSTARYMVDFAPVMVVLACIGLLSIERLAPAGWRRRAGLTLAAVLAAGSVGVCALLNVQLLDLLRQNNPGLYRSLSHAFDTPVAAVERAKGTQFGPLEMTVHLPSDKTGKIEPLVATGWEFETDFLFVNYLDAGHIRIGFEHTGYPIRWSGPIGVDYRADHTVRASMGSLYPPHGHPFFDAWDNVSYDSLCRWLLVAVDGTTVLDVPQEFYDGSPGGLWIGREPVGAYGSLFTGRVAGVHRVPLLPERAPTDPRGPVQIEFSLPGEGVGRQVPILGAGEPGRADTLFLRMVGPGRVRFYYEHWDDALIASGEIRVGDQASHTLVVSTPALWSDDAGADASLRTTLLVKLDGRAVAFQTVPSFAPRRGEIHFGLNAGASRYCEAQFPWPIGSVRPVAIGAMPPAGTVDPWGAPRDLSELKQGPQGLDSAGATHAGPATLAVFCAWVLLLAWILGRLSGHDWPQFLGAAARPLHRPAAWAWRHKGTATAALLAAAAVVAAVRQRDTYLHAVGPVHLRIQLPQGYWGRAQTLLATGTSGAGANYFVAYTDRKHIQLGADIWGANYLSKPIAVDYRTPQDIVINASGLYPREHPRLLTMPPDVLDRLRTSTLIELGGQSVLSEARTAYDSRVSEVTVGETKVGFSNSEHLFKGRILQATRLPIPNKVEIHSGQAARLHFRLDPSFRDVAQPLLSIGPGGRQGLCYVTSVADPYFRLGFVGPDGASSEWARFQDFPGAVHEVEVTPGYTGTGLPRPAVRVVLDGVQVSSPAGFVPFDDCPVVSGLDHGGLGTGSPIYLGPRLDAETQPASAPPTTDPSRAPLLLVLKFPAATAGSEPLLVTGAAGAGDLLYVQYVDDGHVRFGYDHWNVGGAVGESVPVDFRVPHRIEIESGALSHP